MTRPEWYLSARVIAALTDEEWELVRLARGLVEERVEIDTEDLDDLPSWEEEVTV